MPAITDATKKTDFSSNKGTLPWESSLLKPGAKDSIGSESNTLAPMSKDQAVSKMGPFGGEKKG